MDRVGADLQRRQIGLVNRHRPADGVGHQGALAGAPVRRADLDGEVNRAGGGNHGHGDAQAGRVGRHVNEIVAAGAALDGDGNAAAGQGRLALEEDLQTDVGPDMVEGLSTMLSIHWP